MARLRRPSLGFLNFVPSPKISTPKKERSQPHLRGKQSKNFFFKIHIFFVRNGIVYVYASQKVCPLSYYPLFFTTMVELHFQKNHCFSHHHHFNYLNVSANKCQMEELLKKTWFLAIEDTYDPISIEKNENLKKNFFSIFYFSGGVGPLPFRGGYLGLGDKIQKSQRGF